MRRFTFDVDCVVRLMLNHCENVVARVVRVKGEV